MTYNRKIVQLTLIFIGLFLIFATYFLYPRFNKKIVEKSIIEDEQVAIDDTKTNTFKNVEYKGFYNFDNPFSIKSEIAHISVEEPDIIHMTSVKATIVMKDGRLVIITSDKSMYNKITYDCFFEDNVKVTDGETVVFAENLNLLASKDTASIYNSVSITNDKGDLIADKIDYNFETKYYKISMFNNKRVKAKLIR
tara:strand:+ start:757 stop:1341 length:585 start_codon:yes stop_codon:yes gene_type:complete